MDRKILYDGGEPNMASDDFLFMQDSHRKALHSIAKAISKGVNYIISGCDVTTNGDGSVNVTAGHAYIDGECVQVDEQLNVANSSGTGLFTIVKNSTFKSEGDKTFDNGIFRNTAQETRGIVTSVASLSDSDLSITDKKLSSAIRLNLLSSISSASYASFDDIPEGDYFIASPLPADAPIAENGFLFSTKRETYSAVYREQRYISFGGNFYFRTDLVGTWSDWHKIKTSNDDTGWISATLLNNWDGTVFYRKKNGYVELRGEISVKTSAPVTNSNTFFTFPTGYRPAYNVLINRGRYNSASPGSLTNYEETMPLWFETSGNCRTESFTSMAVSGGKALRMDGILLPLE